MKGCFGVRKGAWTEEEDNLLRKCVEKYGEEKWHQVPLRAGLNRCRKSCRLRWINYLKPNIKRGEFAEDEVDLILKRHKLLGNRLPGRTANAVKNYWNTHLRKKHLFCNESVKRKAQKTKYVNVIKPRPRTLSKNFQLMMSKILIGSSHQPGNDLCKPYTSILVNSHDNESIWWKRLLAGNELIDQVGTSSSMPTSCGELFGNLGAENSQPGNHVEDNSDETASQSFWNDLSFDLLNTWNL